MRCARRPETGGLPRAALRAGRAAARALGVAGALGLAVALLGARPAMAEDRWLLQGLFDAEYWNTDAGSVLLSKNGGEPAPQGRLRLWAAGDFLPGFQGFALEEIEGGKVEEESGPTYELEQAYLRYTFKAPRRLIVEAGKLPSPIGNFSGRYFSSVNPLIGEPDGYGVSYPLGLQLSGGVKHFDYRVAMVDLPLSNENYVPAADRAMRPALAAGVTPVTGLRLGAYWTRGPYLNDAVTLPAGAAWKDYSQQVVGFDLRFSRGYFELNGDFNRNGYEVPGQSRPVRGKTWFLEPKYTFTPRFFAALRLEQNDYAYIANVGPGAWFATSVMFYDAEAGIGCRLGAGMILKVSYRQDRWHVDDALKPFLPDGHSVAAQLSYSFDAGSWIRPPR